MNMDNIKCLIVNWDGVCVSSLKARHMAYLETFRHIGQANPSWTEADTKSQSGRNPNEIWADTSLWGEKGKEAREFFYKTYAELLPTKIELKDHITAFLRLFGVREKNVPIIAFGAKTQEIMQREIDYLIRPGTFTSVYGSRKESALNKNLDSPRALENIIQDQNLPGKEGVLYLGYKASDEKAAQNAGIRYQNGSDFILNYLNEKLGERVEISQKPLQQNVHQNIHE